MVTVDIKDWDCLVLWSECNISLKARSGGKEHRQQPTCRRVEERRGWIWLTKWESCRAEASSAAEAILSYMDLFLTLWSDLQNTPSCFILVLTRVRRQAARTWHPCASWILRFVSTTYTREFSAIFSSNIAILPITLVSFPRTHHRCMLPPSLITSLAYFFIFLSLLLYSRKLSLLYLQFINSLFSSI